MKSIKLMLLVFALGLSLPHFANAGIEVAITVDDLPAHGQLPLSTSRVDVVSKMISIFKKYKIPEVYGFINGGKVEFQKEDAEVLKLWRAAGYPLGNHTYSHLDLNRVSVEEFQDDIKRNESVLEELNGKLDWNYFRYPFLREGNLLEKRDAIRKYLNENEYKIAQVTIDFEDWAWNDPYSRCISINDKKSIVRLKKTYIQNSKLALEQAQKVSTYLFKRPIKHILLLHIGAFDAEMLEELIKTYKSKGVRFIPLSEAIKDDIYTHDPMFVSGRGREFTIQVMVSKGIKLSETGAKEVPDLTEELSKMCK